MNVPKRTFAPIPLDTEEDDRIDQYAATQGIPDSRKAMAVPIEKAAVTMAPRAELQKVTFELPAYALKALKQKALDDGVSIRHVIMRSLVKEGIAIETADLIEDGRRRSRG